jgi:hypothetical protein
VKRRLAILISGRGSNMEALLRAARDPETGVQNTGMYRAALKAKDRLVVRMVARPGGAEAPRKAPWSPAVRTRSAWRATRRCFSTQLRR